MGFVINNKVFRHCELRAQEEHFFFHLFDDRFIIDIFGFGGIFFFASICMFAAFLVMGKVSKGETIETEAA